METALDKFMEVIPEGRNEKCPCGCGTKWKKVDLEDLDTHIEAYSKLFKGEK